MEQLKQVTLVLSSDGKLLGAEDRQTKSYLSATAGESVEHLVERVQRPPSIPKD